MTLGPHASILSVAKHAMRTEAEGLNGRINRCIEERTPDCPFVQDRAELKRITPGHRRANLLDLHGRSFLTTYHIAMNVDDHVAAFSALLHDARLPLTAQWSLTRAAMEGAVRLRYVLDSTVSAQTRLLRGVALMVHSIEEELAALNEIATSLPVQPGLADVTKTHKNLAKLIKQAGLHIVQNAGNGRTSGVKWDAVSKAVTTKENTTELIQLYFRELPAIYRFTSGTSHSIPWVLDDHASVSTDPDHGTRMAWTPDPTFITAAATVALQVIELVLQTYAWYHGLDEEQAIAETRQRRRSIDRQMSKLLGRPKVRR